MKSEQKNLRASYLKNSRLKALSEKGMQEILASLAPQGIRELPFTKENDRVY